MLPNSLGLIQVTQLLNVILAASPDVLMCLFIQPLPTRAQLLQRMAFGWPNADETVLEAALDALIDAGHILPSVAEPGCFRLKRDISDYAEGNCQLPKQISPVALELPRFSYFRGGISTTIPHASITPGQLFAELISDRHRVRTAALRAVPRGSAEHRSLKNGFDYVTPAGVFARRRNASLSLPSGLLVLDFDHIPDLHAARTALLSDKLIVPELALLFTSPSGDGLKALVQTDMRASHQDSFRAWADYIGRLYADVGLIPDEAGKDPARACFVPHAPDAWLAPTYRESTQPMV